MAIIYPLAGLYSSTKKQLTQSWIKPRSIGTNVNASFKCLDPSEKALYHSLARDLFRSSPSIRSAITRKNAWAAAQGWTPFFGGVDREYGKLIIEYLNEAVLPACNTAGANYTFNRTLLTIANEIDVGGDVLVIFTIGRDGLPKLTVYPSSAVGYRLGKSTVQNGRYKNLPIHDGVVHDRDYAPIAFSIFDEDPKKDYFVSARNSTLLFEPQEGNCLRGISEIAAALFTALNVQDVEEYLSKTVKLQSKFGLIFGTKDGSGNDFLPNGGYSVGSQESSVSTEERQEPVIDMTGDYVFCDAKNNEGVKSFEPKQPGENVQEFLNGLEEKVLYQLGWHLALISPNSIGSYAARVMESQVQQMVATRQQTLKRVAKTYCLAAIAKAIEDKILPAPKGNSSDWRNIDFHLPAQFVIDSYYLEQTNLQKWTTGNASLQEITARSGVNWQHLREQREAEAIDALERAQRISQQFNIPIERALDLITKQTVNAAPAQQTPAATNTSE